MTPSEARDAFDPGPLNNYPNWPRDAEGKWDVGRMPFGLHRQLTPDGTVVLVDITPYDQNGDPICPPDLDFPPGHPYYEGAP
jgi:hypothetical protein